MNQAVPDLHYAAGWPLAQQFLFQLRMHHYLPVNDQDPLAARKKSKLIAVQIARDQIELLAETRCKACNGYAHTDKHCQTNKKLQQFLGATGIGNNRYHQAFKALVQEEAQHLQPAG